MFQGGKRRGSWVRVRVRKPQEMFDTAESQNIASLSDNAIPAVTKTSPSTIEWTPEPSTETTPTSSSSPSPTEPSETINFEDALKDMLKDFITNTEDEKEEEEVITEPTADTLPEDKNVSVAIEDTKSEKHTTEEEEKQLEDDIVPTELAESAKSENEDETIQQDEVDSVKTMVPDLTPDAITQQPTTIIQSAENYETTIEPEFTTVVNEQEYKSPPSRILGTSTTTEISLETEICYRGRCVKTKKVDSDSDLLPME